LCDEIQTPGFAFNGRDIGSFCLRVAVLDDPAHPAAVAAAATTAAATAADQFHPFRNSRCIGRKEFGIRRHRWNELLEMER